ncbi:uncharacterized protein J3R85_019226 [Psidium guajava]|nr:uncharacterized protein J3R85_019226 [Psidium guajava]
MLYELIPRRQRCPPPYCPPFPPHPPFFPPYHNRLCLPGATWHNPRAMKREIYLQRCSLSQSQISLNYYLLTCSSVKGAKESITEAGG